MYTAIVAGAGHGGLTAAYNLAKNGWKVIVVEAEKREKIGHDWHDTMKIDTISQCGFDFTDESVFLPYISACFTNPAKSVKIPTGKKPLKNFGYISRKYLVNYLIDECEKAGVEFRFETKALCGIITGKSVAGITVLANGKKEDLYGDVVIDATGMDSAIRKTLPWSFGIEKEIDKKDTFFAYRAYFEKDKNEASKYKYNICFFHCGKPGMDWLVCNDDYADILVGGFGGLTDEQIKTAIADYKEEYPFFDESKIISGGGSVKKIPLRKALPLFVADNYAAVGDSASMVEPLSGSGINLSMKAGKLLADTLIDSDGDFSIESLWKYQHEYFKRYGEKQITPDILRIFLSSLDSKDIDALFEQKFLTINELGKSEDKGLDLKNILEKARCIAENQSLHLPLVKMGASVAKMKIACKAMPCSYNKNKTEKWKNKYKEID